MAENVSRGDAQSPAGRSNGGPAGRPPQADRPRRPPLRKSSGSTPPATLFRAGTVDLVRQSLDAGGPWRPHRRQLPAACRRTRSASRRTLVCRHLSRTMGKWDYRSPLDRLRLSSHAEVCATRGCQRTCPIPTWVSKTNGTRLSVWTATASRPTLSTGITACQERPLAGAGLILNLVPFVSKTQRPPTGTQFLGKVLVPDSQALFRKHKCPRWM